MLGSLVGTLDVLFQPAAPTAVAPAPLADDGARPGQVGALLPPDAVLRVDGALERAVLLRPAVVVLVTPRCRCASLVDTLAG